MDQSVLSDMEARRDRLTRELAERDSAAKKAGGVVCTPPRIVDYLVERTVGPLLEDKTPRDAARLRILDPACGAGAFLLGAYGCLLDWHLRWYLANGPERHAKGRKAAVTRASDGTWRLHPAERQRILLNSIFGVDIDPAAVELSLVSLLLVAAGGCPPPPGPQGQPHPSVILGEAEDDMGIGRNIRLGDALIGPDFAPQGRLFGEAANPPTPFDWQAEFPEVFSGEDPGFDLVLGNPPYLSYSGREAVPLDPAVRAYFSSTYETAGWPTAHGLFIERAVKLLSRRIVAFIVPDQVGHLAGYRAVRALVARHSRLAEVRYWGEAVFPGVVTPALTFVADKQHRGNATLFPPEGLPPEGSPPEGSNTFGRVRGDTVAPTCTLPKVLEPSGGEPGAPWVASPHRSLLEKLRERSFSLGDLVADPGVHTGNCARKLIFPLEEAPPGAVPLLEGRQVSRYQCLAPAKALRLGYAPGPGEYFTIRPEARYASAHFLIRQTAPYPIVGPRLGAVYFRNSLLALYPPKDGLDIRYLVALLNSKLLRFIYMELVPESRQRAFPQVKVNSLRRLPIRSIDLSNTSDATAHARLVALADRALNLTEAREPAAPRRCLSEIDEQIDRLVYELYGLTDDEAALVGGATHRCSPGPTGAHLLRVSTCGAR